MNWIQTALDKTHNNRFAPEKSPFVRIRDGIATPIDLRGLYQGQACFLTASGPSLAELDTDPLKKHGVVTMGLNNSPKIFRPKLWMSVDNPARFLESVWRDPTIMKFCGTGKWKQPIWDHNKWAENGCPANNDYYSKTKVQDCPNVYHIQRNNKFNPETYLTEPTVNWGNHKNDGGGRSVFIAAIKTLYVLGFRRIYLVGVDFKMTSQYTYTFTENRHQGAVNTNNSTYRKMISYFTQLSPKMQEAGFYIFNSTPYSDFTLFPYVPLEEAVENEIGLIPNPETEQTENMYVPNR